MQTQISTRINIDTARALDEYCDRTGKSKASVVNTALVEYLNKKSMTARQFLDFAGVDVVEENLYHLTRYLDSNINFAQFPDAAIPEGTADDADEPAGFQEYIQRMI